MNTLFLITCWQLLCKCQLGLLSRSWQCYENESSNSRCTALTTSECTRYKARIFEPWQRCWMQWLAQACVRVLVLHSSESHPLRFKQRKRFHIEIKRTLPGPWRSWNPKRCETPVDLLSPHADTERLSLLLKVHFNNPEVLKNISQSLSSSSSFEAAMNRRGLKASTWFHLLAGFRGGKREKTVRVTYWWWAAARNNDRVRTLRREVIRPHRLRASRTLNRSRLEWTQWWRQMKNKNKKKKGQFFIYTGVLSVL